MAKQGKRRLDVRKRNMARYGMHYLPFKPPGYWRANGCCYCGNIATTRDHIPPLDWLAALGPTYFDTNGILIVWVPSCKECNNLLSNLKLFTIKERTNYLIGAYEKRYKRFRAGIPWSDAEISELTGRLKIAVSEVAVIEQAIDRRIEILEENLVVR